MPKKSNSRLLRRLAEFLIGDSALHVEISRQEQDELVLARINLDEEVAFVDRRGIRSLLRHDPRTRQITVRSLGMR